MSAGPVPGEPEGARPRISRRALGVGAITGALAVIGGATASGLEGAHTRPRPSALPSTGGTTATTDTTIHATAGNQTEAVRAWLARPSADGTKRMVGAFVISATLFPAAHTRLDLADATIALAPGGNTTMIALARSDVSVSGGRLLGRGEAQTDGGNAIAVTADGCSISGTRIEDVRMSGIEATGVGSLTIDGVTVVGSGNNGIYVETAGATRSGVTITGCTVDRAAIPPAVIREGGIKVHGGRDAVVNAVTVSGCTVRLPERPADYGCVAVEVWYAPAAVVRSVTTAGGYTGVSVATSPGARVSGSRVTHAAEYGIELASAPRSSAVRNTVEGSSITRTGIALTSSSEGTFSDGASLTDNGVFESRTNGIFVLSAADVDIARNLVTADAGYLVTLTATTGGTIRDNDLNGRGAAQKCVMLDTCSGVSVVGNDLSGVTETGVYLYSRRHGYAVRSITIQDNRMTGVNTGLDAAVSRGARLGGGIVVQGNSGVRDSDDWAGTRTRA